MLALKQTLTTARRTELRWDILFGELSLFTSLTLARLIVWLTIRRRRKERAVRRKLLAHSHVR